ncbi:MAG: radical SAM protein [candidate division Zixibacteria bacterium]|nr:radical SAM protein [candidate division Zixibacteria bacterium]
MDISDILDNYIKILEGARPPRFKNIDLTERVNKALEILKSCTLCERACEIDRTAGEKGECRVGMDLRVASAFDHMGEEFFFIPSYTIFFASCTFHCLFCQNSDLSQVSDVDIFPAMTPLDLARLIDQHGYCKNMNFVGGEPTPYLPFILETLTHVKSSLPVVWNSNFYMSRQSMALLKGLVDVYLSDFKYGNDACAKRLSGIDNYFEIVGCNHLLACDDTELVIRHLVLPNHFECCTKPVFDFIAEHMKDRAVVNVMDQYRPCYRADKCEDINRRLKPEEFREAVDYAEKLGLVYIT